MPENMMGGKVFTSKFEKRNSAPLITSVVAITPVPLLYHAIFYIVRYNSPTTHPSKPTYTSNELKKETEKED